VEVAIPIGAIWRLLTWLPNFILRRVFTKERLSELVLFDVRPRHDPATVNLGSPASYELWLRIINISPFLVVLDQASFKFQFGGVRLESHLLEHMQFPAGEVTDFHIEGAINEEQAAQMALHIDSLNGADLSGVMEFNCKLHSFSKSRWQLNGIKPRVVNADYRRKALGVVVKT
jgi:hypothetical protein